MVRFLVGFVLFGLVRKLSIKLWWGLNKQTETEKEHLGPLPGELKVTGFYESRYVIFIMNSKDKLLLNHLLDVTC